MQRYKFLQNTRYFSKNLFLKIQHLYHPYRCDYLGLDMAIFVPAKKITIT